MSRLGERWLNKVTVGDAEATLREWPDECVHCVVTSPPYWALRNYDVLGQIGLEATPEEYVDRLVSLFREVRRVLRRDGTLWLNLGDCYTASGCGGDTGTSGLEGSTTGQDESKRARAGQRIGHASAFRDERRPRKDSPHKSAPGLPRKNLVGIPWRVAFALQADGWNLRIDNIWSKPNPLPEPVTDRPTKSHEYVFLFSKAQRYYYDGFAIRERSRERRSGNLRRREPDEIGRPDDHLGASAPYEPNGTGRNRRSVWEISTQPYPEAHFATFPEGLVAPCVMAGSSEEGCCSKCGAPWTRKLDVEYAKSPIHGAGSVVGRHQATGANNYDGAGMPRLSRVERSAGWTAGCECGADVEPCVVLDPFIGSGTTGLVALKGGRRFAGVDLNPEYAELARKRLAEELAQGRLF